MSIKSRVVWATVTVAIAVVVAACFSAYFTTRTTLINSVDQSLLSAYSTSHTQYGTEVESPGAFFLLVSSKGVEIPASSVPLDAFIKAVAAKGTGETLRTVTFGGTAYRELVVGLTNGTVVGCANGQCEVSGSAAGVYVVNITGQITQLAVLAKALITIALGGVALALLLGMLIGRAAISPLSEMADEIEGVANSKDLSIRVKEKGRDELGRLGRVFNRLLGDIQLSRDQQRQLVMDASHELRTPLTSLRTNAQVIGQVAKHKPEDLDQLTEDMVSQVDELSALVSDLAELARGERSEGAVVEVDLSEVVHECVAVARTHARVKAIEIEHESTPGRVLARQDRLVQLVNNLLSNAVKFTPEGGHIKVTSEGYVLTVQDSGPGIAPEDRAYVTQRFWRSPAARSMPGSGLGLSIVAQVAGEMGGVIGVGESQELGGAQISVSFMQQDLRVK